MSEAIDIISNQEYTLADFNVLHQGKKTIQLQSKGVTAVIFVKLNDTQGYPTTGTNLSEALPLEFDVDPYTYFKIVFGGGSVTAKVVGQ